MSPYKLQITLGAACMEITPKPAASNASELLPKINICGVVPTKFESKPAPPNDVYWTYRFDTVTVVRIYMNDGRYIDIELQEVSNQPTWSGGALSDLQKAVADINAWLIGSVDRIPEPLNVIIDNDEDPYAKGLIVFDATKWSTFTGIGSVNFTTPGEINFTGGDNTINNYIDYIELPTALERSTTTVRFTMSNTSSTVGLFGMGLASATSVYNNFLLIDVRIGASGADAYYFYANSFDQNTGVGSFPFSDGDEFEIIFEKTLLTYSFTFRNVTQNSAPLTLSKSLSILYGSVFDGLAQISRIRLFQGSGDNKVTYLRYESPELKYCTTFLGDSKTEGFFAQSKAKRFSDLWSVNTGKLTTVLGGQGNRLAQFVLLNKLVELLEPTRLVMMAPFRNDIGGGTFDATAESNYLSIVSNAESVGAEVWHHNAMTEVSLDQSSGNAFQSLNFPANRIILEIETWNPVTDNVADGVHPDGGPGIGNSKIASNIQLYID